MVVKGVRLTVVPIAKSSGVPTYGEFGDGEDGELDRQVVSPLDSFVRLDRVLYQGADEIPGMTDGLRDVLRESGYEFVSQMFSEFIKRIDDNIEKDIDAMYINWLKYIVIQCDHTEYTVNISEDTYAAVTESMRVLAEEKGLIEPIEPSL